MSAYVETMIAAMEMNRTRTLGLLDGICQTPDPQAVLGWRPGPGRAHIAWQLMHIAITEELFATERLAPHKAGAFTELWSRFRGGSTPDDQIPTAADIRKVLSETRVHLLDTLQSFGDADLGVIPAALKERGLTIRQVFQILNWHEAHHQGQSHLTFNLYKASH